MNSKPMNKQPTINDNGFLVYPNGFKWHETQLDCVFVARDWHAGQDSSLYRLSCGDYSPDTVSEATNDFEQALDQYLCDFGEDIDPDTYSEAVQALRDLDTWARGIKDLCSWNREV